MNVVPIRKDTAKRSEATYLPADFKLTPALQTWATAHGITKIKDRMEHFTDTALAKGYRYVNWDAAFRNACRQDWARLGGPSLTGADVCCKCGNALNGYTMTREGKMCNNCWGAR